MLGVFGQAAEVVGNVTNQTLGRLETGLPASKAELKREFDKLQNDNAKLEAEHAEDQALINSIVIQVNKLTPVSRIWNV